MNVKLIKPDSPLPQKHILYDSIYVQFYEMQTNAEWPKAELWLFEEVLC